MIPRRRIEFAWADFRDAVRAMRLSPERALAAVRDFEDAFARAVGVPHAIATASGRDALGLILDGLGLGPGDELVIPAYTLGELVPLMRARGIRPVPADIDPETFNVRPEAIAARIGERTRGVLVVHLLGAPCDIRRICAIAARHAVPVIEDCAHAFGACVEGQAVGSFGRAALFSLESTKAVATYGGGVLATRDEALARGVRAAVAIRQRREGPPVRKMLLKWGEEMAVRSPAYALAARLMFSPRGARGFEQIYRRANDRVRGAPNAFSAFQALVGLRRLGSAAARSSLLNARWEQLAQGLPAGFAVQRRGDVGAPSFYNFVARFDGDLEALRAAAQRRGLDLGIRGEVMDDTASMLGYDDCPGAARAYAQAVLLPLYVGLGERRFRRMLGVLHAIAGEAR